MPIEVDSPGTLVTFSSELILPAPVEKLKNQNIYETANLTYVASCGKNVE
jgi:hypothetical protein